MQTGKMRCYLVALVLEHCKVLHAMQEYSSCPVTVYPRLTLYLEETSLTED